RVRSASDIPGLTKDRKIPSMVATSSTLSERTFRLLIRPPGASLSPARAGNAAAIVTARRIIEVFIGCTEVSAVGAAVPESGTAGSGLQWVRPRLDWSGGR